MAEAMSVNNVCEFFSLAAMFENRYLMQAAMIVLERSLAAVMKTPGWVTWITNCQGVESLVLAGLASATQASFCDDPSLEELTDAN